MNLLSRTLSQCFRDHLFAFTGTVSLRFAFAADAFKWLDRNKHPQERDSSAKVEKATSAWNGGTVWDVFCFPGAFAENRVLL